MRKSGAHGRNPGPLKTTKDGAASFVIIQTLERLGQPPKVLAGNSSVKFDSHQRLDLHIGPAAQRVRFHVDACISF